MRLLSTALACLFLLLLPACAKADHPDEGAIKAFLERYFSTWSARDMDGYGGCFLPQARISFVGPGGETHSDGLTDFLHGQKLGHTQAATPMTEVPTAMQISGDARVAQAAVRWRLTKGAQITTGTDYFTLVKTSSGWKIIALVFYND